MPLHTHGSHGSGSSAVRVSILLLLSAIAGVIALPGCKPTPPAAENRVAKARDAHEAHLRAICAEHGLSYPPQNLFLRAFKQEQILEVWAGQDDQPLSLLLTLPFTASSGTAGPKRREGDRQIPEGCYVIERFNPESKFHLSMGLNYPNDSDRHFANPEAPGSDIFIHGSDRSIGCIAIGDEPIEKLFVLTRDWQDSFHTRIPVHIFPAHFESQSWLSTERELSSANPGLAEFWDHLRPVYASFEKTRRIPEVAVDGDGRYRVLGD